MLNAVFNLAVGFLNGSNLINIHQPEVNCQKQASFRSGTIYLIKMRGGLELHEDINGEYRLAGDDD